MGIHNHTWPPTVFGIVTIAVVPFGVLGISAWVGIVFPYHPLPLRRRWEHRHPPIHMLIRWACLVLLPYVLVPILASLVVLPSFVLWSLISPNGLHGHLPDSHFGAGVALACAVSVVAWFGGHRVGISLTRRRQDKLISYLSDTARG